MKCAKCNKEAHAQAVAYYNIGTPGRARWKCWFCLSPDEKAARDPDLLYADWARSKKTP